MLLLLCDLTRRPVRAKLLMFLTIMQFSLYIAAFDLSILEDPVCVGRHGDEGTLGGAINEIRIHDAGSDATPLVGDDRAGGLFECG